MFGRTPDPEVPTIPSKESVKLRGDLISEEYSEVMAELGIGWDRNPDKFTDPTYKIDVYNLAKELCDLLYVIYGTGAAFGIPLDKCFKEVHRSNMSKLDADGNVLRREDGKVLKSDLYEPADLTKVF